MAERRILDDVEVARMAAHYWWEAWSNSPQATVFVDSEWELLAQTAVLVERYWLTEDSREQIELLREITRREEECFGYGGAFVTQTRGGRG